MDALWLWLAAFALRRMSAEARLAVRQDLYRREGDPWGYDDPTEPPRDTGSGKEE